MSSFYNGYNNNNTINTTTHTADVPFVHTTSAPPSTSSSPAAETAVATFPGGGSPSPTTALQSGSLNDESRKKVQQQRTNSLRLKSTEQGAAEMFLTTNKDQGAWFATSAQQTQQQGEVDTQKLDVLRARIFSVTQIAEASVIIQEMSELVDTSDIVLMVPSDVERLKIFLQGCSLLNHQLLVHFNILADRCQNKMNAMQEKEQQKATVNVNAANEKQPPQQQHQWQKQQKQQQWQQWHTPSTRRRPAVENELDSSVAKLIENHRQQNELVNLLELRGLKQMKQTKSNANGNGNGNANGTQSEEKYEFKLRKSVAELIFIFVIIFCMILFVSFELTNKRQMMESSVAVLEQRVARLKKIQQIRTLKKTADRHNSWMLRRHHPAAVRRRRRSPTTTAPSLDEELGWPGDEEEYEEDDE